MSKFVARHSILNAWDSGKWQRAIKTYFRMETYTNKAMQQGKKYHAEWEQEVERTNKIPKVFGDKRLNNPKTELLLTAELRDWLYIRGRIDVLDEPVIYDWKTGVTESNTYVNGYQMGMYALLCRHKGFDVEKAEIYHYNQYSEKVDMSIVWITDKYIADTINWIVTIAGEMHTYFEENNLYEKYGKRRENGEPY